MDKLKVVWRYTRKYGFWVVSLICLLLVCFIWRQVAGSLLNDFSTRKSEIEGNFSSMQSLASAQDQPNMQVVELKQKSLQVQSENVLQSWEQLYNTQKSNNIWPISDQRYKRAFEEAAERKRASSNYELSDSAKEYYWQYIRRYLRKIKETYDIKRPNKEYLESNATLAGNTGMRSGNTGTLEGGLRDDQMDGIVYWDDTNFKLLENRLSWRTRPSTQQILVGQEDLWVYEALLRIIKETNVGKSAFNASVKEIYALEIAQDTIESFEKATGRILKVGEKKSEDGDMMSMESSMMEGGEEEVSEDPEFDELFADRYVNSFGKPLSATELKESPPFAEFKMMPVRMHLMINQRAISQLLVNCINSSMPVEVLQISINPERGQILDISDLANGSSSEGGMGAPRSRRESRRTGRNQEMMGGYEESSLYGDEMTRGRSGTRGGGMESGRNVSNRGPEDVDVEVLGMIYIFNPPAADMFPILQEQEENEEESTEENTEATATGTGGEESSEIPEVTAENGEETEASEEDSATEGTAPEPEEAITEEGSEETIVEEPLDEAPDPTEAETSEEEN